MNVCAGLLLLAKTTPKWFYFKLFIHSPVLALLARSSEVLGSLQGGDAGLHPGQVPSPSQDTHIINTHSHTSAYCGCFVTIWEDGEKPQVQRENMQTPQARELKSESFYCATLNPTKDMF